MGRLWIIICWIFVVLFVASRTDLAASDHVHTMAVMNVDAGASTLVVDQLTAEMSSDPTVRLVERDAINRLVREQELTAMGLTASSRVKVGQLLGADVLVLVSKNPNAGTNTLLVLVCDSSTGARIGRFQGYFNAVQSSLLAGEIRNTLAHFPHGVRSVVAVPDLISDDLRLEHAELQTGLAELLREVLDRKPGLAVVEFDEAKALAGEHELTSGKVQRIVPLYVEGQYRTREVAEGGPQISISFTLRMAQHDDVKLESGWILLGTAEQFVAGTVPVRIAELLKQPAAGTFDPNQEFTRLTQRADEFAGIGDFDRSAALREAALLLKPEADEQRIRLLHDYSEANLQLASAWPKGTHRSMSDPWWVELVAHRRETWRRSLSHVEYLVHNHRVDISEGTQLVGSAVRSIVMIRGTEANQLTDEENLKKEFLRSIALPLFNLSSKNGQPASQDQLAGAAGCLSECVLFRVDGNFLREDDLALLGDFLCDVFPKDTPLLMNLIYLFGDGTQRFGGTDRDISPEVWLKFVQRLLDSPRPMVHAYGRYARLCDQRIRQKLATEDMLTEARSLADAALLPPLAPLDPRGELHNWAFYLAAELEAVLQPSQPRSPISASPREIKAAVLADGSYLCDRVRLRPVKFLAAHNLKSGTAPVYGPSYQNVACDNLFQAWDGVDVIYNRNSVTLLRKDFNCEEVFSDNYSAIGSVVFDGQQVWISTGFNSDVHASGIYAIDRDGQKVISVGLADGLPESRVPMPLVPLSPGRVMAAGSIQQGRRGWLATIQFEQGKPQVNVFHEAMKVPMAYGEAIKKPSFDPAMGFEPTWITEYQDETNKRWAFVGRNHSFQPLMVDLDTFSVSVYPAGPNEHDCFPRTDTGSGAFWSQNGLLYVAGSNCDFKAYRLDPATHHLMCVLDRSGLEWDHGHGAAGGITEHEGYLYYTGDERWLRCSIKGDHEEVLIASTRLLPNYGSGNTWRLGVSSVAGLVAWSGGQLYRVTIEAESKKTAAQ